MTAFNTNELLEREICFTKVSELLEQNIITDSEMTACKNSIDFFDLVTTVTVRIIMNHIENGVEFLSLDGVLVFRLQAGQRT